MAQTLTFNLPNMSAVGATMPINPVFRTSRTGADRLSKPVQLIACHFDEKARAIRVFCSDGLTRQCNIERLPSIEHARSLWKALQEAGKNNLPVKLVAAGGFSPDRWFYNIEVVADETL